MKKKYPFKKVIIDPGHVGKTFFDFRHFILDEIEFHEGEFCYAWAEILQKELEGKIEKVSLSRSREKPSFLIDLNKNKQRQEEILSSIGIEEALKKFRVPRAFFPQVANEKLLESAVQNEADLICRSNIANDEKFDLCLSLHLNGDPKNLSTTKNGICGFTNQISKEHFILFQKIIQNIALVTNLPIIQTEDLKGEKGVFVDESLTLLRNINIPTLLIEGPFQNNPIELQQLNQSLNEYHNDKKISGRLEQLTKAIVCSF